jgi:CheY-like chemotaxis protein
MPMTDDDDERRRLQASVPTPTDTTTGERPVLALVADLIFGSKIRGAARATGVALELVRGGAELLEAAARLRPRLVIVDLEAPGVDANVISGLKGTALTGSIPVVAFGSHVHADVLSAARAAGADRVLARSAFVKELPSLFAAGEGRGV